MATVKSPHPTENAKTRRLFADTVKGDFKVIVAIDFGTHGTGLGYAIINEQDDEKKNEVYIEQDWCRNTDNKTKTDILLSADGTFIAFGDEALEQYTRITEDDVSDDDSDDDSDDEDGDSDDIKNEEEREKMRREQLQRKRMLFESFKMALYEKKEDGSDGDIRDKIFCNDGERTYETSKVFTEALKYMKTTILNVFSKKGIKLPDGINNVQWILTVPAIWSDRAKHKMERWARKAGLINKKIHNHLRIVYEPDCASISCQYEAADEDESSFQAGQRYILIDAGGGTVDIACHQVRGEMQMEEIYHPTGGPWGSDYIDDHFENLLKEVFSPEAIAPFKEYKNSNYTIIKSNFRQAKMKFFNKPDAKFHRVKVTTEFMESMLKFTSKKFGKAGGYDSDDESDPNYLQKAFHKFVSNARPFGVDAGCLKMDDAEYLDISSKLWKEYLFDKVIDPMVDHVEDLISKVTKIKDKSGNEGELVYICIAGGLASSRYFQNRIHTAFGKGSKHNLSIRVPRRPILSVIDGALKLGLNPYYIKTRKVKYTYGIAVDRSEANVRQQIKDGKCKLPPGYLEKNWYNHPHTNRRTIRNLFSPFIKKNEAVDMGEAIEKTYRRFHKNEKTSKISIYHSAKDEPYVIEEDQVALASVTINFPEEYKGLPFIVQFFFGDTTLKASVLYVDQKDSKEYGKEILMEDLELEFNDLYKK